MNVTLEFDQPLKPGDLMTPVVEAALVAMKAIIELREQQKEEGT